jgi:5'-nucleotidase
MTESTQPQILLTNDDGIESPGLWAAAEALSSLGYVTVAAPREQASGSGRSMPIHSDGILREEEVTVRGKTWRVYAVGGSPAQAVQHGVLELTSGPPDLVVAGINYGENLTVSVTISGTVGAALEGAAFGIPALAISLEMPESYFMSHSEDIDFTAAAHFTELFGRSLLETEAPQDVDMLKVDIPSDATVETPWRLTRLSRVKYYIPVAARREQLGDSAPVGYEINVDESALEPDSDAHAVRVAREVSVTPLSLDLTSRVDFESLNQQLRSRL